MEKFKFIYDIKRVFNNYLPPGLLFFSLLFVNQAHSVTPLYASFTGFSDPLGVFQKNPLAKSSGFSQQPDTLNILALRAEFVEDNLATTTGNGLFDLSVENDI